MHDVVVRDLEAARDRTLGLTDLGEPTLVAQHGPLMSPLVWDLAHVGQQEELWLLRGGDPARLGMLTPDVDALYDAFKHPRAERPGLPLLPPGLGRCPRPSPRRRDRRRGNHRRSGGLTDMPAQDRVQSHPDSYLAELRADVRAGLTSTPKSLPPKYFYDERGSELFDEITRLPEYYPTRAETAILQARAAEIAALSRCESLVELGSGTSAKTGLLLKALRDGGTLREFMPFDVDPAVLAGATEALTAQYPGLRIVPFVGDFERDLGDIPAASGQPDDRVPRLDDRKSRTARPGGPVQACGGRPRSWGHVPARDRPGERCRPAAGRPTTTRPA